MINPRALVHRSVHLRYRSIVAVVCLSLSIPVPGTSSTSGVAASARKFHLEEATIGEIQAALLAKQITTEQLVKLYLARIKAYNGTCVKQPDGILGVIETIPHAGQLNPLSTLNRR